MESCVTCGHPAPSTDQPLAVRCNGPCGRRAHPWCAKSSGIMLTASADDLFWFCAQCRRGLSPAVVKEQDSGPLLDALRKLGRRMDTMDDCLRKIEASVVAVPVGLGISDELAELPVEVWTEIFGGLSAGQLLKVRLVCRRWRGIVDGSWVLIGKLAVNFVDLVMGEAFMPENLPPVKKVYFRGCKIRVVGLWWTLLGQSLTEIRIGKYCWITCSILTEVLKHVPNLKSLRLHQCIIESCSEKPVADFKLAKVENLTIEYIEDVEIYLAIPRLCNNLKCLRVRFIPYEAELRLAQIVASLHNTLEEFHIIDPTDDFLETLMTLDYLKLKKLTLAGNAMESEKVVLKYCKTQPNLEYLKIGAPFLMNELIVMEQCEFGKLFPNLTFFSFHLGFNQEVDLIFLSYLTKLQSLELFGNDKQYSTHFPTGGFPKLQRLLLRQIHFPDSTQENFLVNVPNLRSLIISGCYFDCWSDLLEALESLKLLQNLSLIALEDICSKSFYYHDEFRALRTLHLECYEMPQELLEKILQLCPHVCELRVVHLEWNEQKLAAVCRELTQLRKLSLVACQGLSLPKDVEKFVRERSRSLWELEIFEEKDDVERFC